MKHMVFGNYYKGDSDGASEYILELTIFNDTVILNPVTLMCEGNNFYNMHLKIKDFNDGTPGIMYAITDGKGSIQSIVVGPSVVEMRKDSEYLQDYLCGQSAMAIANYCHDNNIIPPLMNIFADSFGMFLGTIAKDIKRLKM